MDLDTGRKRQFKKYLISIFEYYIFENKRLKYSNTLGREHN